MAYFPFDRIQVQASFEKVRLGQARAEGQKMPKKTEDNARLDSKNAVFWAEMDDFLGDGRPASPAQSKNVQKTDGNDRFQSKTLVFPA